MASVAVPAGCGTLFCLRTGGGSTYYGLYHHHRCTNTEARTPPGLPYTYGGSTHYGRHYVVRGAVPATIDVAAVEEKLVSCRPGVQPPLQRLSLQA